MSKNNDDQSNDFLSQWEAFKKEFLNDADDADFTSPYSSMHPHPADGSDDDGHTSDYTYESSASSRAHDDADNASDKGGDKSDDGKHSEMHSDERSDKHDDKHADEHADKGKKKARKSSHGESEFAQQIGLVKDITHELKELGWGSGFWGKWLWIIIAVLAVIALIILSEPPSRTSGKARHSQQERLHRQGKQKQGQAKPSSKRGGTARSPKGEKRPRVGI